MGRYLSLLFIGILWVSSLGALEAARTRGRRCPSIDLENGRVRIKSRGRVAKFRCRKPYTMFEGDRFATCVRGQWNGKIPKCIRAGCDYLDSIPHGDVVTLYDDAVMQFYCNPGYALEGSPALTCDGHNWNDTAPVCQAPLDVAKSCDFEDASICGWMNEEVDEFDWTRQRGPTASFGVGTGPQSDHTLGTLLGHYMYIESSIPRVEGDRARLYSPVYQASLVDGPSCFAFYYHMYGNTTGVLNVYLKGVDDNIEYTAPIYHLEGHNQEQWMFHVIHLHSMTSDFQIILEGVRGQGYMSDIAIDDVQLAQDDECQQLQAEADRQFVTVAVPPSTTVTATPVTTTATSNYASTDISETTISTRPDGTTADTVQNSTTTVGQLTTTLAINGTASNATSTPLAVTTTQQPVTDVNQTVAQTVTPTLAIQTSDTSVSTLNHTTILVVETTTKPIKTTSSPEYEEEDLYSCRNRCGEIAVDVDSCGCDIMCRNSNTCCLDIEKYCHGFLTTPPPITTTKSATSASTTTIHETSVSYQTSTEKQLLTTGSLSSSDSSAGTTLAQDMTSESVSNVSATQEVTPEEEVTLSTILLSTEPQEMTSAVSITPSSSSGTSAASTATTEVYVTPVPSALTEKSTAETTEATSSNRGPSAPRSSSLETTLQAATTTPSSTSPETTTEVTSSLSMTTALPVSDSSTTSATPAPTALNVTSSTVPPSDTAVQRQKGLSEASVYTIAISVTVVLILLAVFVVAYVRKMRRDKLPEDSDIRFLARDEVMMEGNVFSLTGTITQARNTPI